MTAGRDFASSPKAAGHRAHGVDGAGVTGLPCAVSRPLGCPCHLLSERQFDKWGWQGLRTLKCRDLEEGVGLEGSAAGHRLQ